ncbi:hypothetical protein HanIR_Chr04g0167561 [Helianthus annuus]|nr:hypothetical protein HanIR_Chr04g0167561 [Helianthus annuus]
MQEEFEAKVEIFLPSVWLWDLIFQRCLCLGFGVLSGCFLFDLFGNGMCGFQSSGCAAMITWSNGLSSRYLRSSCNC